MSRKKWFWLAIYLAMFAVCVLVIYVAPSVVGLFESTYVADYGDLNVADKESAYIVRDETVYVADKAGEINSLVSEGELVNGKSGIVQISGSGNDKKASKYTAMLKKLGDNVSVSSSGVTDSCGYVSYYMDGFESKLASDTLDKLSKKRLTGYSFGNAVKTQTSKCAKGDPIFKITENGDWWMVFFVDKDTSKHYKADADVTIKIDGNKITGKVYKVGKSGGEYRVILSSKMFFKDYLKLRQADITVTTASAKGVIIKNSSIVKKDGKKGVLVKNKIGKYVFKPVMVKAANDEESAVFEDYYADSKGNLVETISIYDEVLKSPSKSEIKDSESTK